MQHSAGKVYGLFKIYLRGIIPLANGGNYGILCRKEAGFIANLFVLWGSKSEVRGCTVILLLIDLFFVYAVYKEAFQWTPRNRMLVLLGTNIYLLFLHLFHPFEEEQSAGS